MQQKIKKKGRKEEKKKRKRKTEKKKEEKVGKKRRKRRGMECILAVDGSRTHVSPFVWINFIYSFYFIYFCYYSTSCLFDMLELPKGILFQPCASLELVGKNVVI